MKGRIEDVESWIEDGDLMIVITYEDGGYDEMRIYGDEISTYFDYVPEGC